MDRQDNEHGSEGKDMIDLRQGKLDNWQRTNFGKPTSDHLALGMTEELGELCHILLKRSQGIRGFGYDPETSARIGDAVADVIIFGIQLLSTENLNAEEVLKNTIDQVLTRDWATDPKNGITATQHKEGS